jgi:dihydroflavonol-4-reductase
MKKNRVLFIGVTGFLGSHTAIQLLNRGYEVIGTLRSKERIEPIRRVIAQHTKHIDKLSFAVAELTETSI